VGKLGRVHARLRLSRIAGLITLGLLAASAAVLATIGLRNVAARDAEREDELTAWAATVGTRAD
jgi:hypothetical protein